MSAAGRSGRAEGLAPSFVGALRTRPDGWAIEVPLDVTAQLGYTGGPVEVAIASGSFRSRIHSGADGCWIPVADEHIAAAMIWPGERVEVTLITEPGR